MTTPGARHTDPDTSHGAAKSAAARSASDRARVLAAHRAHPEGLTDFELAEIVGRQQTSAGKRRGELCTQGLIEPTALRRPTPSGSTAIVWRAVRQVVPPPPAPPRQPRKPTRATQARLF